MNLTSFENELSILKSKIAFHKKIGRIFASISLGFFTNNTKISLYQSKYDSCFAEINRIKTLLYKADELDNSIESFVFQGVRISKNTFGDLPVINTPDYGIDWNNLRELILTRDNYECQEIDGYCNGPLQIHHIMPLSKGGANDPNNLITLCFYHHCMKHDHMKRKYYGNIWS